MDDAWKHGRRFPGSRIRPTAVHGGQARPIVIGEDPVWLSYHHGRRKTLNLNPPPYDTKLLLPRLAVTMLCAINVRVQYSVDIDKKILYLVPSIKNV